MLLKNFVAAYQSLREACAILGFLFVYFETATGQLAQWPLSNTTWFVSLRPQRVSWLNGRHGTLLGLYMLRPQDTE